MPADAEGLPSFFQSSVPPKPKPPAEILEKPKVTPTPTPAPPPPTPPGQTPDFFKPRPLGGEPSPDAESETKEEASEGDDESERRDES